MVFRRRGRAPEPGADARPHDEVPRAESDAAGGAEEASEEGAADSLAAVLRAYGEGAFDMGELSAESTRALCEAWARHVLLGTPVPTLAALESGEAASAPPTDGGRRREWGGLQRTVHDHRGREQRYVRTTLDDLQQAIWAFVGCLSRGVVADDGDQGRIEQELVRVRDAVSRNDTAAIRSAAMATADAVGRMFEERSARKEQEVRALAEKLDAIGDQLRPAGDAGLVEQPVMEEHLARVVDLGVVFDTTAYLLLIEPDDLGWLREERGVDALDAVCEAFAAAVQGGVPRAAFVTSRFGSRRIAVVTPDIGFEEVQRRSEDLLDRVRALEVEHAGEALRITASIGVAPLIRGEDRKRWLERAEAALGRARETGADRFAVELPEA